MIDNINKVDIQREQILAAKISIWGSIILFLVSAGVGIAVDSITLILDASASLVILFVAFLMHFSIKKVHKPADDLYNFGYGKYEPLTVAIQGILIIATCVISMKFAIQDIIHADEGQHSFGLPVVATFLSGVLGIFIMSYIKGAAKRSHSAMLETAGFHWGVDTLLSFGVCAGFLFGLILENLGFKKWTPYVDPVMAIILALFFVMSPVKTIMHNVFELLDAVPDEHIRSKVREVVKAYTPHYFAVHRLRTRKAGEKIFVEVCFIVKHDLTINEVEGLAGSFEKDLKKHFPVSDVVVYFKPAQAQRY
jgi:cation diffusion facilitator family transporter